MSKHNSLVRRPQNSRFAYLLAQEHCSNAVLRGLAWAARSRQQLQPRATRRRDVRSVVHISPAYFSEESYVGGGERWAMSLAKAMAEQVETVFVTFGTERRSVAAGALRMEIFPTLTPKPAAAHQTLVNYGFLREVFSADVVHCHHFRTLVSSLAVLGGASSGARVFVTDLGGSTPAFAGGISTTPLVDGFLHISQFAAKMLPDGPSHIVYGGVPGDFLEVSPRAISERTQVLCVARLLPHKGINYLIEAIPKGLRLEIIGRPYDPEYFSFLRQLAEGKDIRFTADAGDAELKEAYRRSFVTVLPSVYRDCYGTNYEMPELLGLVLLESMASGTAVICTDVASMPEFVEEGVTGFLVPPNDPRVLRERIEYLAARPELAAEMGTHGRQKVIREFTWKRVVDRCLAAYREA